MAAQFAHNPRLTCLLLGTGLASIFTDAHAVHFVSASLSNGLNDVAVSRLTGFVLLQNLIGLALFWGILFGASALFVIQYQNGIKREQRQR